MGNLLDSRLIFRAAENGRRHGDIDALRHRKGRLMRQSLAPARLMKS